MCLIKNYNLMDGCYVCNDKEKQYSIAEWVMAVLKLHALILEIWKSL